MRFVSDNRASRILYNYLSSNIFKKPFIVPVNVCDVIPKVFDEADVELSFVDLDSESLCADLNTVKSCSPDYSGLIFVHTYGTERSFESDFKDIKAINPDFVIIDDRCLCMPSTIPFDTYADLCLFSVGEKKQVDLGCGGFAFLQEHSSYFTCPLKSKSFLCDDVWDLDKDIFLESRANAIAHRELINDIYRKNLPKKIQFNEEFQNWRFNIHVDNKEVIIKTLFSNGLFASSHYKSLVDLGEGSIASRLSDEVINLFNDYHYSIEMAKRTCETINRFL